MGVMSSRLELHQQGQQIVYRRDHFRGGLEAALILEHVDGLFVDVHATDRLLLSLKGVCEKRGAVAHAFRNARSLGDAGGHLIVDIRNGRSVLRSQRQLLELGKLLGNLRVVADAPLAGRERRGIVDDGRIDGDSARALAREEGVDPQRRQRAGRVARERDLLIGRSGLDHELAFRRGCRG